MLYLHKESRIMMLVSIPINYIIPVSSDLKICFLFVSPLAQ